MWTEVQQQVQRYWMRGPLASCTPDSFCLSREDNRQLLWQAEQLFAPRCSLEAGTVRAGIAVVPGQPLRLERFHQALLDGSHLHWRVCSSEQRDDYLMKRLRVRSRLPTAVAFCYASALSAVQRVQRRSLWMLRTVQFAEHNDDEIPMEFGSIFLRVERPGTVEGIRSPLRASPVGAKYAFRLSS